MGASRSSFRGRRLWLALGAAWLLAVGTGFTWTLAHGATPGVASRAAELWPRGTSLALDADVPTLVMFAHPRCPCTRASLHELEWVLARAHGKVRAYVVFARPTGAPPGWGGGPLRAIAAALPGVTVLDDDGDAQAHLFGATSSGHVAIYAPSGALRFSGGVTAERGHEGPNAGRDGALEAIVGAPRSAFGLVFGCSLDGPRER